MNAADLKAYRERAGVRQGEMAELMGLGISAYQVLEAGGGTPLKPRHLATLEHASTILALERKDVGLALPGARKRALDLAALIRGE